MCAICILLDKSFPKPRELARAYGEVAREGLEDQRHHFQIEAKMDKKIEEQNMTPAQLQEYIKDYNDEVQRLGSWEPK